MADKEEKLLAEFEAKVRQLVFFCDSLKMENKQLRAKILDQGEEMKSLRLTLDELNAKCENLKFAKSFASDENSGGDVESAKRRLSKLVRDVDKCIALLKG